MWQSVIAILGTLAGAAITALFQQRAATAERRETRKADHRRDALAAVTEFAAAVANHRRAMWVREEARLTGADAERLVALREASHNTREAITAPHVTLAVLAPELRTSVEMALQMTYAMRNAASLEVLEEQRSTAVAASYAFTNAAARALRA